MHELAKKNKYIGLLFMKISPEYFKLGKEGIHQVSKGHARDLAKFAKQLEHVVCAGLDARFKAPPRALANRDAAASQ